MDVSFLNRGATDGVSEQKTQKSEQDDVYTYLERVGYKVDPADPESFSQAVTKFQEDQGLPVTGELDETTSIALKKAAMSDGALGPSIYPEE